MWRDEIDRRGWLRVVTCESLPQWSGGAALLRHRDGRGTIILDQRLEGCEIHAAVLHEAVHADRRRDGRAHGRAAREEQLVNEEVTRALMDLKSLAGWCRAVADIAGGITPEDVADEFDVPVWVAEVGLQLLLEACPAERRTA